MSSYKTFTKLSQRLSGQWVKNCQANITPSCRGGEEGGRWKQLGATSAPRSMMLCTDLCTVRSAYPAYSPAKLKPAPVGQLCVRWYFAITLMAVGLMSWANSLRNILVKKLCCRPGGHWKWPWGGCLPISPGTGPPHQSLFRATVYLAFHRLFTLAVSRTHTQYFCSSREVLPQPLQSQAALL